MMKLALSLSVATLGLSAFALELTEADRAAKARFCDERLAQTGSVQQLLLDRKNHLAFANQGGMMNGGVCWWHSRYTRNAAYLAQFRPDLPRPTDENTLKRMVVDLRKGKKIVVIPGYRNLGEFSASNYQAIQNKLEDWQETDGILHFQWVAGLSGNSEVSEENLAQKMDQLFERVSRGEVVYQKLQMPGIVAHAWLVVGMTKLPEGGYRLNVVDSNNYGASTVTYRPGMKTMGGYYNFVPYTGKTKEERRLRRILRRECADYLKAREAVSTDVDGAESDEADGEEDSDRT